MRLICVLLIELILVSSTWSDWECYFLPSPYLNVMPVHHKVIPLAFYQVSWHISSIHIYSWLEIDTVSANCFTQEHNTMTRPSLEPGSLDLETRTLTIWSLSLQPRCARTTVKFWSCCLSWNSLKHIPNTTTSHKIYCHVAFLWIFQYSHIEYMLVNVKSIWNTMSSGYMLLVTCISCTGANFIKVM